MQSKHQIVRILLLFLLVAGCKSETSEFLQFDLSNSNHVSINAVGEYEYEITTGGGDPYVYLEKFNKPLTKDQTVLTFEYSSPSGINFFEVYFFSEETGSFGSNVAGSQKSAALEATEGVAVYSVDLGESLENFNWDSQRGTLRFDFGDRDKAQLTIRNIHFRKRDNEELAALQEKEAFRVLDQQANDEFANYLSSDFASQVTRVEVKESTVLIEGTFSPSDGKVVLHAVKPWDNITTITGFDGVELTGSPFSVELERYEEIDGHLYDNALTKWSVATGNKLLSPARYADHIQPERDLPKPTLLGRKGIGGYHVGRGYASDLTDFPVTSITVNIWFTRFMYMDERDNTIPHEYGGKTYYFDAKTIDGFDRTMLEAQKHNIIVAAIVLVNPARGSADPKVGELLQDENFEGDNAFYTMPNMTSIESVHCYAAALDFLASRYSREDSKYGRIHHWIMHNEVDAGNVWTNMGLNRPLHVFLNAYYKSMRLCYNIARKYDQHSEVFASFTHSWAEPVPVDGDYSTLELLEGLLDYSGAEGDFQWGIAYHPYPEDLNEPKTWNDKAATFTMDSPMVTFKNLEVLDKWVKQDKTKFLGEQKRTVWLSENGTNSRSYSEQDLAEQAAGFAYAWKKMKDLDGIDAFQWHNWMDARGEFGLRIGLRKYPDDETDPAGKKPVWYLYQAADTPREDEVFEPYKSMIGINDWSEIMEEVK